MLLAGDADHNLIKMPFIPGPEDGGGSGWQSSGRTSAPTYTAKVNATVPCHERLHFDEGSLAGARISFCEVDYRNPARSGALSVA
jgi:hypothetical protein